MNIKRYNDSTHFLQDVETFLLTDEYMNNLMLGLLYRMKDTPTKPNDLFLTVTHQNEKIVGLISGLYLIIYANTLNPNPYIKMAEYLHQNQIHYPGVIGPNNVCQTFVKTYNQIYLEPLKLGMSQRIFVNKKVNHISTLDAKLVLADEAHKSFLLDWMYDFLSETLEKPTPKYAKERLDMLYHTKGLYVLEHEGQIVCMAGSTRPFRNGISVGYVYTPTVFRNRGYATKCVELLTEKLLETYVYCTLYTDLANPISNSIYQKIGYIPVGDSVVYIK